MRWLSKFKIIVFIGYLFCITNLASSEEWPPEVDIYAIRFDYESGYTDDALDIRKNNSTDIPLNEWLPSSGNRNNPFAYIKNQSARKIQVIFYVEDEDYRYIAVHTTTSGDAGIGDVDVSFSVPWYEDEYWLKTITLGGEESVPSSVGNREFTWSWYLDEIGEIELEEPLYFASTGDHKHYTLLAAPQSPMSEPWTEVLDYATGWAEGETSSSGAITEIAKKIYGNLGLAYDIYEAEASYALYYPSTQKYKFELTNFLNDIPGSNVIVDCHDNGMALTVFANSIGCDADFIISSPFGWVNCIIPVGREWTNNPVYGGEDDPYDEPIVGEDDSGRTKFTEHAFAKLNSNIYDATLTVDTDANPDAAPHSSTYGSWALGWSWSNYKTKVVDDDPSTYTGSGATISFTVE